MWVLPRDQLTVGDHMNSPVCRFRKDSTQLQHLVFDKERYDLGEAHIFLLAVGKARHFPALHQRPAVGCLDMAQRTSRMTHDRDCLAGGEEGLDQFDRVVVLGEIPHRTVTARIEHRVEVFLLDAVETNGLVELRFRLLVVFKAERELGAVFGFVALGIERRPSAFRGSQRDINAGILEDVVGSGKLFEPKPVLRPVLPSWSWEVITINTFMIVSFVCVR